MTFVAGPEDNGSELRCEATNSAVTKPVSETITIELLPESTTSTSTESVSKMSHFTKDVSGNNIETTENNNKDIDPEDEYAYYDDDQFDYYNLNNIEPKQDPFAHPEDIDISTNILTGKEKD